MKIKRDRIVYKRVLGVKVVDKAATNRLIDAQAYALNNYGSVIARSAKARLKATRNANRKQAFINDMHKIAPRSMLMFSKIRDAAKEEGLL